MSEGRITAHVLDTARGHPARGVRVSLARLDADVDAAAGAWVELGERVTDDDGRVHDLHAGGPVDPGTYRITFDTGAYLAAANLPAFYPRVEVVFRVDRPAQHHHIPLLLSPFGYSTYRGS